MPPPSSAAAASSSSSSSSSSHDDLVARAVEAGIASHAELPPRVRALLPASEWRARCRRLLIERGVAWGASSAARGCCGEREYYEALVSHYLAARRVYPYHLAHFVSRVLRVTPPSYYAAMLNSTLRSGQPFASLPNFAAADASRTLGVGRNEFISAANASAASASAALLNPLGGGGGGAAAAAAPSTPSSSSSSLPSSLEDPSGRRVVAAASRRGKAALESLISAATGGGAGSSGGGGGVAAASAAAAAAARAASENLSSSSFSATPPGFPPAAAPWWRAHAVNVGEAEAASLSPEELAAARAAAAPGGVALSDVGFVAPRSSPASPAPSSSGAAAIEALYRRGIVYLSVPLAPEDCVSVPPLEGFVSNRGGAGGGGGGGAGKRSRRERERRGGGGGDSGGGGGSGEQGGGLSGSDDDDEDEDERGEAGNGEGGGGGGGGDAAAEDEDPVEPLLYALLVAAGGDDDEEEEEGGSEERPRNDRGDVGGGESGNTSSSPPPPLTVRRLSEEILGLDLGAALAAASLAVRLGFAVRKGGGKEGRSSAGGGKNNDGDAAAAAAAEQQQDSGDTRPVPGPNSPPSSESSSSSSSSIALLVDAAVTSSLMAGALSPGLKTHAVSLFEGGRVAGRRAVANLLRELDATTEAAERFGAEGGIAELAADATALAVVIRALQASGKRGRGAKGTESGEEEEEEEGGGGGGAGGQSVLLPPSPRVELLRREALEEGSSLPRGAAARLLCSHFDAVVSVSPAAPLGISVRGGSRRGATTAAAATVPSSLSASASASSPSPYPLPLFLGPCPDSTCSPLFSHLLLWALCGRGPPAGAVALPAGLALRKLPRGGLFERAPAAALWCWRGGGGAGAAGGSKSAGGVGPELLSPRGGPGAAPRAPRGLRPCEALLGAGVVVVSTRGGGGSSLLRALNAALASRRSLGGGVIAVPLPCASVAAAAAGSGLELKDLCSGFDSSLGLSSSEPDLSSRKRLAFADVALPLADVSPSSSSPPTILEAVDPWTGEKIALKAPEFWREAVEELSLSSCVGFVRFCCFPGGGGEKAEISSSSPPPPSDEWFPLGIRLGIPLSPRPTCDAVCAALARSDLASPAGIARAREGERRRAAALARFLEGHGGGNDLSVLSRALAFDGKEMKLAAAASASAAGGSASSGGGKGNAAALGRRCLQAPGAVFEV